MNALYVAVGGAIGSVLRYWLGLAMSRWCPGQVPWGTFAVNAVGSLLLGALMVVFEARGQLDSPARFALTIGAMGGFTTYSAFAFEVVTLIGQRQYGTAGIYLGMTAVTTLVACAVGLRIGMAIAH